MQDPNPNMINPQIVPQKKDSQTISAPIIWLGMTDPCGDTCIGPPWPYCACGTRNVAGSREVCTGSCCGLCTGGGYACCEYPCPVACLSMLVLYPILYPLSFCYPKRIRVGPYFCSWACGRCDDNGGGEYNRGEWYSEDDEHCCSWLSWLCEKCGR